MKFIQSPPVNKYYNNGKQNSIVKNLNLFISLQATTWRADYGWPDKYNK